MRTASITRCAGLAVTAAIGMSLAAPWTGLGQGTNQPDASAVQLEPSCTPIAGVGRGGCRHHALSRGRLTFKVRTLAGDMTFARCLYNYEIQVDGRGQTLMSGMLTGGDNPCNDIRPCKDPERPGWLPWHGRIIRSQGRMLHRVDACIDSCIGQFKGVLDMRLRRQGARWRVTVDDAPVGTSGFVLDGGAWDWRFAAIATHAG